MRGRALHLIIFFISLFPFVLAAQKPVPDFISDVTSGCAPLNVRFTDVSTNNPTNWRWDLGNGTTATNNKVQTTYTTPGNYTVKLVATNSSGVDSIIKTSFIQVHALPDADFSSADTVGCAPRTSQFTDLSKPNSGSIKEWQWMFGDGGTSNAPNPFYTYLRTGTYDVSLKVTNTFGCSTTILKPAYISTQPKVTILNAPGGGCLPYTFIPEISASIGDPITSYLWDFGDGFTSTSSKPSHIYNAVGAYTLKFYYTTSSGCKDSLIFDKGIAVGKPFNVDFTFDPSITCGKQMVLFTSKTELPVRSYSWSFGDSAKSPIANPTHRYQDTGFYSVALTVDKDGCKITAKKQDIIYVGGTIAKFTFTKDCSIKGKIKFRNTSINGVAYQWSFGDGITSTETDPEHIYTKEGDFSVQLVSTKNDNCKDTQVVVVPIWFGGIDIAAFSDTICKGDAAILTLVHPRSALVNNIKWDYGDGANSESPATIVKQFYNKPGNYTLSANTVDVFGCKDTIIKKDFLRVNGPAADFDAAIFEGCVGTTIPFSDLSASDGLNSITNWQWNFGDGISQSFTQPPFTHKYDSSGNFSVSLKVTDASRCSDSLVKNNLILISGAKANFSSAKTTCVGNKVDFKNLTTGSINSYSWSFGDGKTSSAKDPSNTYSSAGNYEVKLVVTSSNGCIDSVGNTVKVVNNPLPKIISDSIGCAPASIKFSYQLAADTSTINSWFWSFGNGQTSSLQNPPEQIFNSSGSYTNLLTVVNSSGCSSTQTNSITIYPAPKIITSDTTICRGDAVQLLASGAASFTWSPSANLSCTDCPNPVATPVIDQTYKISTTSAFKCANEDSITIKVMQPFTVSISTPEDSICIGETVQLQALGANNYLWTPSSNLSSSNVSNPKAKPTNDITYTVIGYDSLGCFRDTAYAKIKVYQQPTVELGPDITLAAGTSKTLTPTFTGHITNYLWSPAKDLSCYTCPNPVLSATDNTTYRLIVSNEGCTAEDFLKVIMTCDNSAVFLPNTFSPNNDGMNDVFFPRGKGISSIASLRIFNRWGEMVFSKKNLLANNLSDGWDGMYKGKRADAGAYTYAIEIICMNSQLLKFIGNVTLIQ